MTNDDPLDKLTGIRERDLLRAVVDAAREAMKIRNGTSSGKPLSTAYDDIERALAALDEEKKP